MLKVIKEIKVTLVMSALLVLLEKPVPKVIPELLVKLVLKVILETKVKPEIKAHKD